MYCSKQLLFAQRITKHVAMGTTKKLFIMEIDSTYDDNMCHILSYNTHAIIRRHVLRVRVLMLTCLS